MGTRRMMSRSRRVTLVSKSRLISRMERISWLLLFLPWEKTGHFRQGSPQGFLNRKQHIFYVHNLPVENMPSTQELVRSLDDFSDVVSWINNTLTTTEESQPDSKAAFGLTELDQHVTSLLAAFEIAAQDASTQIEHIIDDVSRGAPRLTYDLHFMRDNALSLQGDLTKVQSKSKNSIPEATASALDRLQHLDTIKTRMEAAREVLREAESWSTLESEVTSLLTETNYEKAAERLNEANRSMVVFQNTSEYESRQTLMISLQNQLEASLSSALVAAINSQDLVICRSFFSIFSNIQRESEFRNYYNGSRRTPLVSMWQSAELADCDSRLSSQSGQTFNAFLPSFFASFLSVLDAERTSIPSIFPDPPTTLSTLITSTLSALQPTFSQRLASLFSQYRASALKEIILLYKATEEFGASAQKIMEKIQLSNVVSSPLSMESGSGPDSLAPSKSHSRRRSMRMSMSFRSNPRLTSGSSSISLKQQQAALVDVFDWDQVLFQPFLDLQVDYASLERRLLDEEYSQIALDDTKATLSDRARLLRERSVDAFSTAEASLTRCMTFTHGYGVVGLVQALDHFFKAFVDSWTLDVRNDRSALSSSTSTIASSSSDEDLSDLDYTAQDWSDIQVSLHLLTSARAVLERLTVFEGKLKSSLIQVATAFRLARESDSGLYIPGTTHGEGLLLAQSTLNSAELQELLKVVEADGTTRNAPSVNSSPLLVDSRAAIASFAKVCQSSLQETILSPLRKHLALYASSPLWSAAGDPKLKRVGTGGVNDLQVPVFSLSPSDVVQRVAEGLLNLPRLFEVYAEDDALAFSLSTLPYIDAEFLKMLSEQQSPSAESMNQGHIRRGSLSMPIKPSPLSAEAVSSAWLSSLGHSILSHLTTNVLPRIRTLTVAGAAQLASDLGYLSNIVHALNVEFEELERWKEYVNMGDEEGRAVASERLPGDQILSQVAKIRGWTTS
ncbi:hypothetical protein SERLA73DRAFT_162884 [Serpula lacrymans var. lacrymans S7.3]|uniref:Conserved oligomeric Golgi complex subunit 7 n=2 Tax=Serpula lacrymans var. lacrymans TaxID=341189 RepID=F8Q9U3_SERL3|nr:uncharacterized protein SERLADRAFT_418038 [Serpula lacrymans var. lacrymans S7.9]EGN94848.1 hypothetical protein SERLA73DRAFT_162884 [Serpula lacrymans var. lacrymans S7.3]EGO20345.1 hypothetical protein SERLADRAFT_418038 [Serpula lacrymans var. lacrymans S7.9]